MLAKLIIIVCIIIMTPLSLRADYELFCEGDLTGDCWVDARDLAVMSDQWLAGGAMAADLDSSSMVNLGDLAIIVNRWLAGGVLDGNGYRIYNLSDVITADPWVDARLYSSGGVLDDTVISSALAAIGSSPRTLLIAGGDWTISQSLIIPSTIKLRFLAGGRLVIPSGVTVTIQGDLEAGLFQIFDGLGTVVFEGSPLTVSSGYTYPQWWGAKVNNADAGVVSRNTFALQAAIASKRVFLSEGTYIVDGDVGPLFEAGIVGSGLNRSSIQAANDSITILTIIGDATLEDMGFKNGSNAVSISTGGQPASINIEDCFFESQANCCIIDDEGDNSNTHLVINESEFITSYTGRIVDVGVDLCEIRNSWAHARSERAFVNRSNFMTVESIVCVPEPNPEGSCWFENYGSLTLDRLRFGSEGGAECGRIILKNYAGLRYAAGSVPTMIRIEDCPTFTPCGYHAYEFYELPNVLTINNNEPYLLSAGYGLYLDASISAQTRRYFPEKGYFSMNDKITLWGAKDLVHMLDLKNKNKDASVYSTSPLVSSDIVFSRASGHSFSDSGSAALVLEPFPYQAIPGRTYQASSDGGSVDTWYTVPSSLLVSNHFYSAVFDVINESSGPVEAELSFGDASERFILSPGVHVLNLQYYWIFRKGTTVRFKVGYMEAGDTVKLGRVRVFKNQHIQRGVETRLYGKSTDAVPSSAYMEFYPGDRLIYTDAVSGGYAGAQCVSAGTPGTWKSAIQID